MTATDVGAIETGLLLVDKPAGPTSHDLVNQVRRAVGVRRVGHTGTLDPFASGLLLMLVGPLTRLAELFHPLPKTYEAVLELGRETDTDDPTGAVVSESDAWTTLTPDRIRAAFDARTGTVEQVPSSYSAVHVDGRRAYELAREGEALELAARSVTVHALEVLEIDGPRVRFRARVSTGTYIRALARDVGRDLGCGAHLVSLRRSEIGPFSVEDACEAGELAAPPATAWRTGANAVPWMPSRLLDDAEVGEIRLGRTIPGGAVEEPKWTHDSDLPEASAVVALVAGEQLVAIAQPDQEALQPRKVFVS